MKYFLEIWLKGFARRYVQESSSVPDEKMHPHITLIRPFETEMNEYALEKTISNYAFQFDPIPFTIEGKSDFNKKFWNFPVYSDQLLIFNNGLEKELTDYVTFDKDLNPDGEKIFHVHVDNDPHIPEAPKIDQYMLWMTGLKKTDEGYKIWHVWDLTTKKVLSRAQALDRKNWKQSFSNFQLKTGLQPTSKGFKSIPGLFH